MKMTPTFAECVLVRRHWLTVERAIILFAYCRLWPHQITYTVSWSKDAVDGALPPKCFDQNGVLTIPNLRPEDEGKYFCTASNQFETKFKEVSLQFGGKRYRRQANRQIIKHKCNLMIIKNKPSCLQIISLQRAYGISRARQSRQSKPRSCFVLWVLIVFIA